jgi:hypothetical protein
MKLVVTYRASHIKKSEALDHTLQSLEFSEDCNEAFLGCPVFHPRRH